MKMILTDLDETLLHSDKTISSYTIEIFNRCKEKGFLVGFCTSRGKVNIKSFLEKIKPQIIICNNGACIYYNDELIHTESFTIEETRKLLSTVFKVCGKNCEMTLDTLDNIFWNRKENKSAVYADDAIYNDFSDFNEPAMKFCVNMQDSKKAKEIASSVSSCDYLPFSDIPWYKFSSGNATKEFAIKFLSNYLNIPLEKIISFGDDFNDIGMLKLCGKGIAVSNAILEVKNIADEVTLSNNEDGVAKYIEKNLF